MKQWKHAMWLVDGQTHRAGTNAGPKFRSTEDDHSPIGARPRPTSDQKTETFEALVARRQHDEHSHHQHKTCRETTERSNPREQEPSTIKETLVMTVETHIWSQGLRTESG